MASIKREMVLLNPSKSRLVIRIDQELHKELKIASIKKDQTLSSFVIEAIKDRINNSVAYKMFHSRIQGNDNNGNSE